MLNEKDKKWKDFVFDFEKLEVYELAIEFVDKVINIVRKLPADLRFSVGGGLYKGVDVHS